MKLTYLLAAGMFFQGLCIKDGPKTGSIQFEEQKPSHPTVTEAVKVSVKDEPNGPMCMIYPGCEKFTKWCKKTGEAVEMCSDKPTYHVEYQCKDGDSVLFESVNGNRHICVRF